MRWSWKNYYAGLFLYRSAFSVAGELLIAPRTPLGDAHRYQVETPHAFDASAYRWSDAMTDTVGAVFRTIAFGNPIVINVLFQTLGFVGIVTLLRRLNPASRRTMAALVLLPSFTLWSSVAAKEAITTMAICFVCTYVVDLYQSTTTRVRLPHVIGAYLLIVYKPIYLGGLGFLWGVSLLARHVRRKALLVTCAGIASLLALYLTRDLIDAWVLDWIEDHPPGRSNRPSFFVEPLDVLTKAPLGLGLSLMGPTWAEAQRSSLHFWSFVESIALFFVLGGLVAARIRRLSLYGLVLTLFTTFWLAFVTYPVGILNPGTAIRYRTNFILVVFLLVTLVLSRKLIDDWVRRNASRVHHEAESRADTA